MTTCKCGATFKTFEDWTLHAIDQKDFEAHREASCVETVEEEQESKPEPEPEPN